MKIGFLGFDFSEGKLKYKDSRLIELERKTSPKKTYPFFVEFIKDNLELVDIIICSRKKTLDLFIPDLEKLERRLNVTESDFEKKLLNKCSKLLEEEVPLCDRSFSEEELTLLKNLQLLTIKPTLIEEKQHQELNQLVAQALAKAKIIFFYTLVKSELKGWPIKKGTTVICAASKIHSDLAKGFIKAEVINFNDFINVHNIQEAKAKSLVKLVGKDYVVEDGDIIEIRFNV